LLRDIRGYVKALSKITERRVAPSDFFLESTYFDATGRELPRYLLTKSGCELCANKLIGEKGVMFTALYVAKFNMMEAAERERELKANKTPLLGEFNSAIRNILSGMTAARVSPNCVMDFLRGIYKPLGIKVSDDSYTPCYYSATDIAEYYEIFSESGKPHSHAVTAIIAKLKIHESQMVAIPYGLVGVTFRYDIDALSAVGDWLAENKFPREVPHLDFYYHICYGRDKTQTQKDEDGFIFDLDEYTAEELNELCEKYSDCDVCPGLPYRALN
jgi:hypothetical protein